jgi:hypothetical protein
MSHDLDLHAVLLRAERAYAAVRDDGDGFLPLTVREHFNYDVPALIGAVKRHTAIADRARSAYGPIDCAEGACDHAAGGQCPNLVERYATADDLELLDVARGELRRINELAQRGLAGSPAQALQAIADRTHQDGMASRG